MPEHHHSIILTPKQRILLAGQILFQDKGRHSVTFEAIYRLTGIPVPTIKRLFPVAGIDQILFESLLMQYFEPALDSIPPEPSLYLFTDFLFMLERRQQLLSNIGTVLASAQVSRRRSAYLDEAMRTQRRVYLDAFGMYCLKCRIRGGLAPQYDRMGAEELARALDRDLFGPLVIAAIEGPEELLGLDLEARALTALYGCASDPLRLRPNTSHRPGTCRSRGTATSHTHSVGWSTARSVTVSPCRPRRNIQ